MESGECRVENVECRMENVECRMDSGECRIMITTMRHALEPVLEMLS
jgi:hypothetical protein